MDRIDGLVLRIALDMTPEEELKKIEGMSMSQLVDEIRRNKGNYTSLSNSKKVKDFGDRLDMTQSMRGMTVKEFMKQLAKIGVK